MNITGTCSVVAEVVLNVAPPAACAAGIYTATPQACGPLLWLHSKPGYAEALKFATEQGCEVIVDQGPKQVRIIVRDTKQGIVKAKQTYNALNTPAGMSWLLQYLRSIY